MSEHSSAQVTVARAPLRISLAGGGTDLPSYARRYGGCVLAIAINRFVSISMFPRHFDGAVSAWYEHAETSQLTHGLQNRFAKAALLRSGWHNNVQLASLSDAPSGTGLGGSGAFLVALLHASHTMKGRHLSAEALAEEASGIEIDDLRLSVGKQDHYMAAMGGAKLLHFREDLSVDVEALTIGPACERYFRERLLLFFTGKRRSASEILGSQSQKATQGDHEALAAMHRLRGLTNPMVSAIRSDQPDEIGPLLASHWEEKKRLNSAASTEEAERIYTVARNNGADGGKILGAGGGGFMLISAAPDRQNSIRQAMRELDVKELTFELTETGSLAQTLPLS